MNLYTFEAEYGLNKFLYWHNDSYIGIIWLTLILGPTLDLFFFSLKKKKKKKVIKSLFLTTLSALLAKSAFWYINNP